ncbi:small nuclear ribonucleoprotein 35kDa (U11 U12) [Podila horticola]|nr:small nuclear ribonucleoprotein 35kDa (U11 U12) [Podila horticola]
MAAHHDRRDKKGWFLEKYDPLQAGSIDGADSEPHDHAIKRAMHATYKKPRKADGIDTDPERTLFIGHLNSLVTSDDLKSCLSHYGTIESASVIRNKVTGISQRYGFVTFQDLSSALSLFRASRRHTISVTFTPRKPGNPEAALSSAIQETSPTSANNTTEDGENTIQPSDPTSAPAKISQPVLVDFERSRVMVGWVPRRLGGGLGGKKESGQLRFGGGLKPFRPPFGTAPSSISPHLQDELCWHPASQIKQDEKKYVGSRNDLVERSNRDRGRNRGTSRSRSPTRDRPSESVMATIIRDPIGRAAIPKLEIATGFIRVQTRGIDGVIDIPPRVATFEIIEIAEITETDNMVCNAMGYQTTCDRVK